MTAERSMRCDSASHSGAGLLGGVDSAMRHLLYWLLSQDSNQTASTFCGLSEVVVPAEVAKKANRYFGTQISFTQSSCH